MNILGFGRVSQVLTASGETNGPIQTWPTGQTECILEQLNKDHSNCQTDSFKMKVLALYKRLLFLASEHLFDYSEDFLTA